MVANPNNPCHRLSNLLILIVASTCRGTRPGHDGPFLRPVKQAAAVPYRPHHLLDDDLEKANRKQTGRTSTILHVVLKLVGRAPALSGGSKKVRDRAARSWAPDSDLDCSSG